MKVTETFRSATSRLILAGTAALLLVGLPQVARSAFPPEKLENLQIFPENTPPRQLIETMKGFSKALGVRCWHCHVGQEGQDLAQFDFVSDKKATKQVAREMMKMTMSIRKNSLPEVARIMREVGGEADASPQVNCFTCHRGQAHPGAPEGPQHRQEGAGHSGK
ncbi:MAG: c-type cytochrome [Acidobacteriota bacterium]